MVPESCQPDGSLWPLNASSHLSNASPHFKVTIKYWDASRVRACTCCGQSSRRGGFIGSWTRLFAIAFEAVQSCRESGEGEEPHGTEISQIPEIP